MPIDKKIKNLLYGLAASTTFTWLFSFLGTRVTGFFVKWMMERERFFKDERLLQQCRTGIVNHDECHKIDLNRWPIMTAWQDFSDSTFLCGNTPCIDLLLKVLDSWTIVTALVLIFMLLLIFGFRKAGSRVRYQMASADPSLILDDDFLDFDKKKKLQ